MLALIDGDIVTYRCAAVNEDAAEGIAKWQADQLLNRILEEVNATNWKVFLSGDNNFRYAVFPEYKSNRRDMVKPKWLEQLREHLVVEWNAEICDGYEADDALGIESIRAGNAGVVCSIDKDLLQLPGNHYNFVKRAWSIVSTDEGWYNFYYQLLVGDATDNIKGCPGIGPVKASQRLEKKRGELALFQECFKAYTEVYKEKGLEQLTLNAKLLYVWREENDEWALPEGAVVLSSSEATPSTSSVPMPVMTNIIPPVGKSQVG